MAKLWSRNNLLYLSKFVKGAVFLGDAIFFQVHNSFRVVHASERFLRNDECGIQLENEVGIRRCHDALTDVNNQVFKSIKEVVK
jgi:hypothetical protein